MKRLVAIWLGKLILKLMRARGSSGSALPGLVVEKFYPEILTELLKLPDGIIMVTGTNGKTTTTKVIADTLKHTGKRMIVNRAGSNMPRGIIAAMLDEMSWMGNMKEDMAVLEVDEAYAGRIAAQVPPRALVVTNLLRDQLDRYGELEATADYIREAVVHAEQVVLNADDTLVAGLADSFTGGAKAIETGVHVQPVFFGAVEDLRRFVPDDYSLHGKTVAQPIVKKADFKILSSVNTEKGQVIRFDAKGKERQAEVQLRGLYNAYNIMAAIGAMSVYEVKIKTITQNLSSIKPAFGRSERLVVKEKHLELLLVKNPAGFNQVIATYLKRKPRARFLFALNDNIADGQDVSWIWDVDIESLHSHKEIINTTGSRSYDMALRLKYAGIKPGWSEQNIERALEVFIDEIDHRDEAYIVATYTAMLAIRKQIGKSIKIKENWE